MRYKIAAVLLSLSLMVSALPTVAVAAEDFAYSITASTTTPSVGSELEVVIALTNYAGLDAEIRGLQIDVSNIDTGVFEVVSHSTMVEDAGAASNKTSYQQAKNLIRYVYLKLSGSMDKSVTQVMKFRLRIKSDLTEDGTVTLPIALKIGTMSQNITLNDTLTIRYQTAPPAVVRVDVSWGSMEFTYDDGVWDTENHKWVHNGWKPSSADSNLITVQNSGNTDVKMQLSYAPSSDYGTLRGRFADQANTVVDSLVDLRADGTEQKYWFHIDGTTETRWSDGYVTVGRVTLTITE